MAGDGVVVGGGGGGGTETLLIQRLLEEIRLLQHAQTLPDYPQQLLQQVQQEIHDLLSRGQQLAYLLSSSGRLTSSTAAAAADDAVSPSWRSSSSSSTSAALEEEEQQQQEEEEEDMLLQKQFLTITLVQLLRARRAYHEEREKILQLMATRACGQISAFDKETLEKLSDTEQQQLKELCEGEATRREHLAWELASERNGKFSAIGEVVFERDSYLEDPWMRIPRQEEDELSLLVAANASAAAAEETALRSPGRVNVRLYTRGRLCRFPLYRARQLHAKKVVTLIRILDCSCSPSPLE